MFYHVSVFIKSQQMIMASLIHELKMAAPVIAMGMVSIFPSK